MGADGTQTMDQTSVKPTSGLSSRISYSPVAGKQQWVVLANRNLSLTCLFASRLMLFFSFSLNRAWSCLCLALWAKGFSGQHKPAPAVPCGWAHQASGATAGTFLPGRKWLVTSGCPHPTLSVADDRFQTPKRLCCLSWALLALIDGLVQGAGNASHTEPLAQVIWLLKPQC